MQASAKWKNGQTLPISAREAAKNAIEIPPQLGLFGKLLRTLHSTQKTLFSFMIYPLTYLVMIAGVFPAKSENLARKIPLVNTITGFMMRKMGKDSRTAREIYEEDFSSKSKLDEKNFFQANHKAIPFATRMDKLHEKISAKEFNPSEEVSVEPKINKLLLVNAVSTISHLETYAFESNKFHMIPEDERYYRIHCPGESGNCGHFFPELALLSFRHPELYTMTYNHPGVEESQGSTSSKEDLIKALYEQVNALLQQGIKPERIELTGFSLGGAIAAIVAERLKNEASSIKVNLFCDRSFNTMENIMADRFPLVGFILRALKVIPIAKEIVHYLVQPCLKYFIVRPLLWLTAWNVNADKAYKNIDISQKAFANVKPKSLGEKNSFLRFMGKYISSLTGVLTGIPHLFFRQFNIFKEGNGDNTIASHASLLYSNVTANKHQYDSPQISAANNAISFNAIQRQLLHGVDINLSKLARASDKMCRLKGVKEADAHEITADEIETRVKLDDLSGALSASKLPLSLPNDLLTYYSIFHHAIQNNNTCNFVLDLEGYDVSECVNGLQD